MNSFIGDLLKHGPILTDGGWTTELQLRGLRIGESSELWNIKHPEIVLEVAASYVSSGSSVILTNTFGANRSRLNQYGLDSSFEEINRSGVLLSLQAAGNSVTVFGSMGPSGLVAATAGPPAEDLHLIYLEHAAALLTSGVSAIVLETMYDLNEACIATTAATNTGLPVVACMTFGSEREPYKSLCGATPENVVERLLNAGADIVGANCGYGFEQSIEICRRMKQVCGDEPLWFKPNAGLPRWTQVDGQPVYDMSSDSFVIGAMKLISAGANFIGGCCGTTPGHIAALKMALYD